jgi:hypothetical protein
MGCNHGRLTRAEVMEFKTTPELFQHAREKFEKITGRKLPTPEVFEEWLRDYRNACSEA